MMIPLKRSVHPPHERDEEQDKWLAVLHLSCLNMIAFGPTMFQAKCTLYSYLVLSPGSYLSVSLIY